MTKVLIAFFPLPLLLTSMWIVNKFLPLPSEPDFYCGNYPCLRLNSSIYLRGSSLISNMHAWMISDKTEKINIAGSTPSGQARVSDCLRGEMAGSTHIFVVHPLELYSPKLSHANASHEKADLICRTSLSAVSRFSQTLKNQFNTGDFHSRIVNLFSRSNAQFSEYELRSRFTSHSKMYDFSSLDSGFADLTRKHIAQGHRVIIVRAPISYSYEQYLKKQVSLITLHEYLKYFSLPTDLVTDLSFDYNNQSDLYFDPDHLNREGAYLYSDYLGKAVANKISASPR